MIIVVVTDRITSYMHAAKVPFLLRLFLYPFTRRVVQILILPVRMSIMRLERYGMIIRYNSNTIKRSFSLRAAMMWSIMMVYRMFPLRLV
jgi:hypothetical protein